MIQFVSVSRCHFPLRHPLPAACTDSPTVAQYQWCKQLSDWPTVLLTLPLHKPGMDAYSVDKTAQFHDQKVSSSLSPHQQYKEAVPLHTYLICMRVMVL